MMDGTSVDMKYSTLIGPAAEVVRLMQYLKSSSVDLKFSNIILVAEKITDEQIRHALELTPRPQGGGIHTT